MMTSWEEEGGPDVAGSGLSVLGLERLKPLIKEQVAMKNREQITESLFTGGLTDGLGTSDQTSGVA
jgi:hypothetical protein